MQGNVITHRETSADVTDVGLWLCGSWLFTLPDMALGFSMCKFLTSLMALSVVRVQHYSVYLHPLVH